MKRTLALAGLLGLVAVAVWAGRTVYTGPLVYEAGLTYNNTYPLNVANHGIDSLSATASYSSATVTSQTFNDGTASTGSITVTSNSNLAGKQGTNSVTVSTNTGISGATIALAGVNLTESIHWFVQSSSNSTATSIKTAINTYVPTFTATTTGNKVNITCASSGTWCNTVPLSVVGTSSLTVGGATFSGGIDNSVLTINNVLVSQGSGSGQWAVGASTAATANAISVAINANSSLSSILTSTAPVACGLTNPCGVVKLTASSVGTGTAYALYSSSNSQLTLSAPVTVDAGGRSTSAMTGGTSSSTTLNSANITILANPWYARNSSNGQQGMTGFAVLYSTGSGVALGGLTNQTTYFVIPVDYNTIKLASSNANAQAGTGITITSSSTQTTAHSFTLAPVAIAGTPSFKWQVSNDGTLWQDFTTTSSGVAVSSVTVGSYTAGGASTSWDFGPFGYTWIRLNVIAPTAGGLNLYVNMNGKTNSSR